MYYVQKMYQCIKNDVKCTDVFGHFDNGDDRQS